MKNTKTKLFGRFWKKSKFIEKEYKEDFEKELIELEKMIDGYLDFARNEREEQMVDASLFKLLEQAAKTSDPKGERISITVPPDNMPIFPIQVQSIRRALINLFTNAIRYAGKATAQIQIFDDFCKIISFKVFEICFRRQICFLKSFGLENAFFHVFVLAF